MDEERKEDEVFPNVSSQKFLFPISSSGSASVECLSRPAALFPCVRAIESDKSQETDLSWLKNESYIPENFQGKTENESLSESPSEGEECSEKILEVEAKRNTARERRIEKGYGHEKKKKKHTKKRRYSNSEGSSSEEDVKKSKHRKKHKKQKHKKKGKVELKSEDEETISKPDTIWLEDSGLSTEEAFRIHRKPDMENLMYGSLYRLDVALFKIRKNTHCLGLGKRYIANGDKKRNKKKTLDSRYCRSTDVFSEIPEFIKPCRKSTKFFVGNIENYSYLPIDLLSKREEENESEIKGKERERDIESAGGFEDGLMTQKTAELNKVLRENPHDVKRWIELVKFQTEAINNEDIARAGYTVSGNERKKKNSKVIREKQISILEKALVVNPTSIELVMYHLELCSDVWEDIQLMERWRKVVFAYPNKTVLWRKYLSFVQSRFSTFTFRKAQRVYDKCFSTLLPIKEETFVSHQAEEGIEEDMLDLFVQHCKFMKQSGHTEKAVACFQAMIELNCLCPSELSENTPTTGQLAFLETFWDSGHARFGETGAVGWTTWMNKSLVDKKPLGLENLDLKKIFKALDPTKRTDNELQSTAEKEEQMVKGMPKWKAWIKVEISRDNSQLKPWQPDTEKGETDEDCEDPERLVLFDDISSYLFKLEKVDNRLKLVLHFLELLGVPIMPSSSSQSFETQRYFELSIHTPGQLIKGQQQFLTPGLGWQMCEYWQTDEDIPTNARPTDERLQLVRNIFLQSLSLFQGRNRDYLMITWLWYEFNLSQVLESVKSRKQAFKEVYKLAKGLLKEPSNRNNLSLWQVFASILSMSGDVAEARRVFDSTLSMASQVMETDKKDSLASLYRAYAELELKESDKPPCASDIKPTLMSRNKVLHLLISFTEDGKYEPINEDATSSTIPPARILKAKKNYAELCENIIQRMNNNCSESEDKVFLDVEPSVHTLVCCALFSYVSSGIQAASVIYDKVLPSLSLANDASNLKQEHIYNLYLNLLNLHAKIEPIPLKNIRSVLHRALKEFPNNPFFLDHFLQVESKSNLTGEVRRFFDHLTNDASSPVPWIYAVHYENMRSKALVTTMDCAEYITTSAKQPSSVLVTSLPVTGISHRQRALLDRATSSVAGRQCVALWKMYMEFELQQGNNEQAKAIFYQALQHCPWAKTLYLDAIKSFPDDLQRTIDLMDEKELRVRTPLEEIEILLESE
ncbi:nuclear exosome regulator NRDE2-like [Actinia tenebrosa]|uniref:Nuclear exosome regulator NRDE2-like n=1 Tax=Actinia tenebrosa TaxID=6105 RepID=A0A6P8I6B5_ACTTE|nr:nuclear exosome regulator NRDE2-like [Actinia tenebrosa]